MAEKAPDDRAKREHDAVVDAVLVELEGCLTSHLTGGMTTQERWSRFELIIRRSGVSRNELMDMQKKRTEVTGS